MPDDPIRRADAKAALAKIEIHGRVGSLRAAFEAIDSVPAAGAGKYKVGDLVSKTGGDYRFDGTVVAAFPKLSGVIRYAVEDDRGILHIYSDKQLTSRPDTE